MTLEKIIATNNDCYKAGQTITPKGIMVHSTGANNKTLRRYVGPDDGKLGVNPYNNHMNTPRPGGRQVCVHAFIGELANGEVATYQILPWNHRAWHGAGSCNNTHIGFEICEDGLTDGVYFGKVYQEAVELCAYLCQMYKLKASDIICHSEGYKKGIASNHADVMHWFPKHGKSMDSFRADVNALLTKGAVTTKPNVPNTSKPDSSSLGEGDVVKFVGGTHYASANASDGKPCVGGTAKITQVYPTGKHPIHIIGDKNPCNAYGWVDKHLCEKQ